MSRQWISGVVENASVKEIFLVVQKAMPISPTNGRPYLSLLLADRTGQLDARLWDNAPAYNDRFSEDDYVRVDGRAVLYQGRIQLHLTGIDRVDDAAIDPGDFLPSSGDPPEVLWREINVLLETLRNPHLCRLRDRVLADEGFIKTFQRVPAGKSIHHARLGGLMEHNLTMLRIVDAIAGIYQALHPELVDRDLLLLATFLHDAGKAFELTAGARFDYTDTGRLVGHVVLGYEYVCNHIQQLPDFPEDLALHLKHLLLAHHGELEHGAPKRPKTIEAWILHYVDILDCRVAQTAELVAPLPPGGWTPYQKLYDRYLWRGHQRSDGAVAPSAPTNQDTPTDSPKS